MPPRQILVRCSVVNRAGVASTRYVPASEFGLWQYVMINRHQIEVLGASVGLWVGASEYARNDKLFERSQANGAGLCAVDRIDLSLYDETLGMVHVVRRFAARAEAPALAARLGEHLGQADAQRELSAGHFVGAKDVTDLRRLSRPIATLSESMTRLAALADAGDVG